MNFSSRKDPTLNHHKRHSLKKTLSGFCTEVGSDLQTLTASDLDDSQCQQIDNKFRIAACIHADKVSGVVRIEKLDMCDESLPFTKDTSYEALVRERLGPDEFIFNLEGPELHNLNLNMQYRGKCVYDLPFQVTTPGPYHLNLVWYRENYGGATEGANGWLAVHAQKPLGERCFVNLTNSEDPSETDRILRHHHAQISLPPCDLRDQNYSYIPGRWVYKGANAADIFRSNAPTYHRKIDAEMPDSFQLHTWARLEDYTWLPMHCALPQLTPEQGMRCLQNKGQIMIEGDSHSRMVYTAVLEWACGGAQQEWGGWESQCADASKRGPLPKVCTRKDGLGAGHLDAVADLSIINMGQWFCDGERRLTFNDYKTAVDRLVQKIQARDTAGRRKVVWHETNHQPLRADSWIQAYGDQRTNVKIAVYNQYATAEMRKASVTVLPAWAISLPLFAGNPDEAHVPTIFLIKSTVKFVAALACL